VKGSVITIPARELSIKYYSKDQHSTGMKTMTMKAMVMQS
jgi:hypothetical protein